MRLGDALLASNGCGEEQKKEAVAALEMAVERSEGAVKKEARVKLHKAKEGL